jgi:hypothetical protein
MTSTRRHLMMLQMVVLVGSWSLPRVAPRTPAIVSIAAPPTTAAIPVAIWGAAINARIINTVSLTSLVWDPHRFPLQRNLPRCQARPLHPLR